MLILVLLYLDPRLFISDKKNPVNSFPDSNNLFLRLVFVSMVLGGLKLSPFIKLRQRLVVINVSKDLRNM